MSIKTFSILASALLVSAAFAQNPQESLGTVRNVQGLVTDINGASVTSTETGEAIQDGERFVTSSSGSVTLQLNNGCSITLEPNQAVTIDKRMTCRELLAAVGRVGGVAAFGGTFGGSSLLAGGTALAAGYLVQRDLRRNNNVSGGGQFNQGGENERSERSRRERGEGGGGGQNGGNDGQGGDR